MESGGLLPNVGFLFTIEKKEGRGAQDPVFVSKVATASAAHPKSGQSLKPAGLDAGRLDLEATEDPRRALADWMVSKENPFFAVSLVNRYWKHFLGKGSSSQRMIYALPILLRTPNF